MFNVIRKMFSQPVPRTQSEWEKAVAAQEAWLLSPPDRLELFGGRLIAIETAKGGPWVLTDQTGVVVATVRWDGARTLEHLESIFNGTGAPRFALEHKQWVYTRGESPEPHVASGWFITHPSTQRVSVPYGSLPGMKDDRESVGSMIVHLLNKWKSEDAKCNAPDGVYLDAETNGLYGPAWAICAVEMKDGLEIARFEGRQAGYVPENQWVLENCYPHNVDIREVPDLHAEFAKWWLDHKGPAFAHMGAPVESGLFRALHERGLIGDFDGPYPLHDVATALLVKGCAVDSVDDYLDGIPIAKPEGHPHDCRYDVASTIAAMSYLVVDIKMESE